MEFKKLELEGDKKGIKALLATRHFKISILSIFAGMLVGFAYFYFSIGREMESFVFSDVFRSVLMGGFLGFFVTNSPCARGRC